MKYLIGLIGLVLVSQSWAQNPFYYTLGNDTVQIDTVSLKGIEDFGWNDYTINLGNHGSPEFSLAPRLIDLSSNDYSVLTFQKTHQFRKYNVSKPVVDAKYVIGSAQEQHFNLLHTQNISRNVNYTVGLNKINSKGLYQNQSTNFTDVYFQIYGDNVARKKYSFDLKFNHINAAASLNGGLVNDSTFTNDTLDLQNRELLDVNLLYAFQEKKHWYGNLDQELVLFQNLDSLNKGVKWSLQNKLTYKYYDRIFYDSVLNADFYDRILNDSTVTNEGNSFQNLGGYLGISNEISKSFNLKWSAGANALLNTYKQGSLDTSRLDIEGVAMASIRFSKLYAQTEFKYLINDSYSNNDYNFNLNGGYSLSRKIQFTGGVYASNERPQIDMIQYSGNNVSWSKNLQKYQVQHFNLGALYQGKWDVSLKLNYIDVINPIYFGYDKTPYQVSGIAQLIRTSVTVENKDHKRWDLGGQFHYQYEGGYNVFRLPNFLAKVSGAFKFKAFKKKMAAAIGTEILYFSKYESKSFDPVTGQFYIYSNDQLGNYPYVNVFIKSRVQRATFFLMMSNPHQGLLGYNYFYFPSYPANDRFFRIGVSWLFTN